MNNSNTTHSGQEGHFSTQTLQAIVNTTQKDMQSISYSLASAQKRGAPTQHWNDRLRQTSTVLNAALKEIQELADHD